MSIKSDKWIKRMSLENGMIEPFVDRNIGKGSAISYGVSSYGYDIRVANEFKIFHNAYNTIIDPKNMDERSFVEHIGDECIVPPNSFVLARSVEKIKVPENVLVVCVGKSTYARCGLNTLITPLEPGWEGYITLEFSSSTPSPIRIHANEGIAQLLFFESDERCEVSYADKVGKYMNQGAEIILPRI